MVEFAGVTLTHPDRVLYAGQGVTKQDLAAYLHAAAPRLLEHASRRLMSLVRCPEGAAKQCFFQRHGGAELTKSFRQLDVIAKDGSNDAYLYLTNEAGLIRAAQMGVLEFHIWGCTVDDIERPNRLVFDLDPDPSVDFAAVKQAACRMRDVLDGLGLVSFPLLTGGKGVHVVVPIQRRHEWPVIKAFTKALAERMSADEPDRYVANMSKAKRKGRIFIDYLRNERGSTAVAPYSPRAREGAPVAWPVTWAGLEEADSAAPFSVLDAVSLLDQPDAWSAYASTRQSVTAAALRAVGASPR